MTLALAVQQLGAQLQRLQDAALGLRTTIFEDRPMATQAFPVDVLTDDADEFTGWVFDARAAAQDAVSVIRRSPAPDMARDPLIRSQEQFNAALRGFLFNLINCQTIDTLVRLAAERQGEWPQWLSSVTASIARCIEPLHAAQVSYTHCWQELVEHNTAGPLQVTAVGVGTVADVGGRPENAGAEHVPS
jgi:hypothetical protein